MSDTPRLSRAAFEQRLESNAVGVAVDDFTLPVSGMVVTLRTSPTRDMIRRSFAGTDGDDDSMYLGSVNLLRFLLVDPEDGKELAKTFAHARGFFNSLDDGDALPLLDRVAEILNESTDVGDAEAPKGS